MFSSSGFSVQEEHGPAAQDRATQVSVSAHERAATRLNSLFTGKTSLPMAPGAGDGSVVQVSVFSSPVFRRSHGPAAQDRATQMSVSAHGQPADCVVGVERPRAKEEAGR